MAFFMDPGAMFLGCLGPSEQKFLVTLIETAAKSVYTRFVEPCAALRKRHRGYGRQIHARVFRHAARAPRARADHRAFGGDALPGENAVLAADFRKHRPGDRALALGQINDRYVV